MLDRMDYTKKKCKIECLDEVQKEKYRDWIGGADTTTKFSIVIEFLQISMKQGILREFYDLFV